MAEYAMWLNFKHELMYKNRFTDTTEIKKMLIPIIENYCSKTILNQGTVMYRARLIDTSDINLTGPKLFGYDGKNSLSPPKELTSQGRLNSEKIPILYLAEDEYTALAEVRPAKKAKVSIATVKLLTDVKLIELDYFKDTDKSSGDIYSVIKDIKLSLYIPVMNDYIERYLPTQFLASFINELGYDGIVYSSSQSNKGKNIGLFNIELGEVLETKVYMLQSVLYYAEEILPRREDSLLLPSSFKGKYTEEQIKKFLEGFRG